MERSLWKSRNSGISSFTFTTWTAPRRSTGTFSAGARSWAAPATPRTPFRAAAFSAPSGRTHHELLLIEVGEDAANLPPGRRVGLYHFGLKVGDSDDELRGGVGGPGG